MYSVRKYRGTRVIVPRFWASKIGRISNISLIERLSDHCLSGIIHHDVAFDIKMALVAMMVLNTMVVMMGLDAMMALTTMVVTCRLETMMGLDAIEC